MGVNDSAPRVRSQAGASHVVALDGESRPGMPQPPPSFPPARPASGSDATSTLQQTAPINRARRRRVVRRRRLLTALAAALMLVAGIGLRQALSTGAAPTGDAAAESAEWETTETTDEHHENGYLPDDELVTISDGYRLVEPAAEAFGRLEAAALEAGFALQINSAYRTYDEQVAMVERYGLLSEGGTAAQPGTSEHGWGIAVDLTLDAEQLAWFQANAGRFGFESTIAGEPWHWAYVGDDARVPMNDERPRS